MDRRLRKYYTTPRERLILRICGIDETAFKASMVGVQLCLRGCNQGKQLASSVDPVFTGIGVSMFMFLQTVASSVHYFMKLSSAKSQARYGVEKWELTSRECAVCKDVFDTFSTNTTKQRHHCYSCGHIVCYACSTTQLYLDVTGKVKRVCDECILSGVPKKHIDPFDVKRSDMYQKVERKAEFDGETRDHNGNVMSPEDIAKAELAMTTSQAMSKKNEQLISKDVKNALKSNVKSLSSAGNKVLDKTQLLADDVDIATAFLSDDEKE